MSAEVAHPIDAPTPSTGPRIRCRATTRRGEQCSLPPVKGAVVCRMHGGAAPQVRNAARRRLLEAADPAAARLVELLESRDEQIRLRAAQALLDRSGHGPSSTRVEVDGGELRYQIDGVDLDQL